MRSSATLLVLVLCSLCLACGDRSTDGPDPTETFFFDSGGAHHLQGFGAWRVEAGRGGSFYAEHQVRDDVQVFESVDLPSTEMAALWQAIDAAALSGIEVVERPGVPDESTYSFHLERKGQDAVRVEIWQNDLSKHPALPPLLQELRTLIERHFGEKPVF